VPGRGGTPRPGGLGRGGRGRPHRGRRGPGRAAAARPTAPADGGGRLKRPVRTGRARRAGQGGGRGSRPGVGGRLRRLPRCAAGLELPARRPVVRAAAPALARGARARPPALPRAAGRLRRAAVSGALARPAGGAPAVVLPPVPLVPGETTGPPPR